MPVKRYDGTNWVTIAGDGAQGPAGTNGMTLISTTTLTGASVVLSSIPSTYKDLRVLIYRNLPATDGDNLQMRLNGDSGANRYRSLGWATANGTYTFNSTALSINTDIDNTIGSTNFTVIDIFDYANTTVYKTASSNSICYQSTGAGQNIYKFIHYYNQLAAINSITIYGDLGNFTSGTVLLYGVS